jgi:hypothetical protein
VGRQFSRLLAAEVCASAVVMLDKPFSEVVWKVLATHSIRQFPLLFPSLVSPCAITFRPDSTSGESGWFLQTLVSERQKSRKTKLDQSLAEETQEQAYLQTFPWEIFIPKTVLTRQMNHWKFYESHFVTTINNNCSVNKWTKQ